LKELRCLVYPVDMPTKKAALARHAWKLMFDFLMRTAPQRSASLGRRGLTPNDARALGSLHLHEGRTMRSLADEWGCDASNATWIVDRLETVGLVERRMVPHDRRVKLVSLTSKGLQTKADLMEEFHTPPPELLDLDRGDLQVLQRVLENLPPKKIPSLMPDPRRRDKRQT
jgi:DNA-binding MarR family transcriptional regulator